MSPGETVALNALKGGRCVRRPSAAPHCRLEVFDDSVADGGRSIAGLNWIRISAPIVQRRAPAGSAPRLFERDNGYAMAR